MLKRYRGAIIAIVALMLLGSLYLVIERINPPEDDKSKDWQSESILVFEHEFEDIVGFSNGEYSLVRNGEEWAVVGRENIKLQSSVVSSMVSECSNIYASAFISEGEDMGIYGLLPPEMVITLTLSSGESRHLNFGNKTPMSGNYYFSLDSENKVYTLLSVKVERIQKKLDDLRDRTLAALDAQALEEIRWSSQGADTIHLIKEENPASELLPVAWKMLAPLAETGNPDTVDSFILQNLAPITVRSFVEENPSSLAKYGLNHPYTLMLRQTDAEPFTIEVGSRIGDDVYVKLPGKSEVYTVAYSPLAFLEKPAVDFISRLLYIKNIDTVKRISVYGGSQDYLLEIDGYGDSVSTYLINGKNISESDFKSKAYQGLIGTSLDGILTGPYTTTPSVRYEFEFKDGNVETVGFLPYEERSYAVSVNGSVKYFTFKSKVDNVLAALENLVKEN